MCWCSSAANSVNSSTERCSARPIGCAARAYTAASSPSAPCPTIHAECISRPRRARSADAARAHETTAPVEVSSSAPPLTRSSSRSHHVGSCWRAGHAPARALRTSSGPGRAWRRGHLDPIQGGRSRSRSTPTTLGPGSNSASCQELSGTSRSSTEPRFPEAAASHVDPRVEVASRFISESSVARGVSHPLMPLRPA